MGNRIIKPKKSKSTSFCTIQFSGGNATVLIVFFLRHHSTTSIRFLSSLKIRRIDMTVNFQNAIRMEDRLIFNADFQNKTEMTPDFD